MKDDRSSLLIASCDCSSHSGKFVVVHSQLMFERKVILRSSDILFESLDLRRKFVWYIGVNLYAANDCSSNQNIPVKARMCFDSAYTNFHTLYNNIVVSKFRVPGYCLGQMEHLQIRIIKQNVRIRFQKRQLIPNLSMRGVTERSLFKLLLRQSFNLCFKQGSSKGTAREVSASSFLCYGRIFG